MHCFTRETCSEKWVVGLFCPYVNIKSTLTQTYIYIHIYSYRKPTVPSTIANYQSFPLLDMQCQYQVPHYQVSIYAPLHYYRINILYAMQSVFDWNVMMWHMTIFEVAGHSQGRKAVYQKNSKLDSQNS